MQQDLVMLTLKNLRLIKDLFEIGAISEECFLKSKQAKLKFLKRNLYCVDGCELRKSYEKELIDFGLISDHSNDRRIRQ